MTELTFVERVALLLGVPVEEADLLTEATVRTLAERISDDEARGLAELLPVELGPLLIKDWEEAEAFPYEEFVERVAENADVDYTTARHAIAAVLRVLRETVGDKEFTDAMAQLPKEFHDLVMSQSQRP